MMMLFINFLSLLLGDLIVLVVEVNFTSSLSGLYRASSLLRLYRASSLSRLYRASSLSRLYRASSLSHLYRAISLSRLHLNKFGLSMPHQLSLRLSRLVNKGNIVLMIMRLPDKYLINVHDNHESHTCDNHG